MSARPGGPRPVFVSLLLLALPASASTGYGEHVAGTLELAAEPPCSTCHSDADAAVPALTPFGRALFAAGARGGDPSSLDPALDGLRDGAADSDGDGARDLDELAWGGDPNTADLPALGERRPMEYGCGLAAARNGLDPTLLLVVLAGWLSRRVRRHRIGWSTKN